MATAPISRKLNLTRDQLAEFLTDQQQIRQFELLFSTVDQLQVIVGTDFEFQADNAAAGANSALAQIIALAQETGVNDAALNAKAQDALDRIALLAQETAVTVALAEGKANQALALVDKLNKAVEGLQMTPPPREFKRARYGQFYDTTTQIAAAINTPQAITFNTTDVSQGVYLGTPTSRVYVDTPNIYNFLFSIQLDKTSGGMGIFWVWPRINGVDVPDSNSQLRLQGNNAEQLCTVGYFFELKANDYVEIMFAVDDVSVQVEAFPASAFYPSIPSIILTVSDNVQGVQ
jgi:hypothetical protein